MPAEQVHLICIAKQPLPGRAKTRLMPEFGAAGAAALAEAALRDTLAVLAGVPAAARTLAFDGDPTGFAGPEFGVVAQRGDGLDERLAAAFDDAWARHPAPLLLLGMDTPHVTAELVSRATAYLTDGRHDAVLGRASDGGWWALGLSRPDASLLLGVPMSTDATGAAQRATLDAAGLRVAELPELTDVDTPEDARTVAATAPDTTFARTLRTLAAREEAVTP